ncbi:uncharacterized protein LOC110983497 [Acanthaster planci]|uniref:Uncharacterized protein LOC110983497 n=1 Tax=Acanthaster planci TaxID=133434 RepID=A0A8B7Z0K9_ACAPL|nr:uncharacterized protein LOC110983497 [Acanthaster planci]
MLDELLASSSTADNSSLPDSPSEPMETEECIPSDAECSDANKHNLGTSTHMVPVRSTCQMKTVGTQTDKVATRVKPVQATERTRSQGMLAKEPMTSTGVMCKLLDDGPDEESSSSDEEENSQSQPESPGYTPESSGSSSDYPSTPHKKTKRPIKRKRGMSPRTVVDYTEIGSMDAHTERKYIVCGSRLFPLLKRCFGCGSYDVIIRQREIGTMLSVTQECRSCSLGQQIWESQPWFQNVPSGNLLLSAATLFAGQKFQPHGAGGFQEDG